MAAVSSIVYQQRSRSTNLDEILENRQIVLSLLLVSVKRVKIYQIKPTSRVTSETVCCAVVQLAAGPDTRGKIKIRI